MRLSVLAILMAAIITAPASAKPKPFVNAYNPNDVAWALQSGPNAVMGSALLRTVGGDIKTCAGYTAYLLPVSAYTTEAVMRAGGSAQGGLIRWGSKYYIDPAVGNVTRQTTCDAQGNFSFTSLPDGEYFVVARVTWGAPYRGWTNTQGGELFQRVALRGGSAINLVLTAN